MIFSVVYLPKHYSQMCRTRKTRQVKAKFSYSFESYVVADKTKTCSSAHVLFMNSIPQSTSSSCYGNFEPDLHDNSFLKIVCRSPCLTPIWNRL